MVYKGANANGRTVGYLLVYAVRRLAPEARDAHHEGQIAEHGFLVE